jgi:hypothetical protein
MRSRSSRSLPKPCLRHRQQEEFAAWPEQVSFFLVLHRALPDLQRMKLCYSAASSARPEQVSFLLVLHRALPDLQRMKLLLFCGRVVGTEVGILLGANRPAF